MSIEEIINKGVTVEINDGKIIYIFPDGEIKYEV